MPKDLTDLIYKLLDVASERIALHGGDELLHECGIFSQRGFYLFRTKHCASARKLCLVPTERLTKV